MAMVKYPEHEKLKTHQAEASILGRFIDFIGEQGWELAEFHKDEQLWPICKRPDEIIGLFLDIDPKKLEAEKRAMLDEVRRANTAGKAGR
jgi:hypothetical protein